MDPLEKDTYTTREAANLLGVSLRTVQLWVEKGTLQAWKTAGGHRRISRQSLFSLMEEQNGALNDTDPEQRLNILIIEDDLDLLDLYRLRMELWELPITVDTAVSGYEGLLKIGEQIPDIVIIDLIMPNMDGFQVIETLVDKYREVNLQIIVITSLTKEEIDEKGGLDPSIEYIQKPVSMDRLQQLVRSEISDTSLTSTHV